MSDHVTCQDKDTLVAYLYGDLDGLSRRRVDDHLRSCAECAAEVGELQEVRGELATWAPPETELGFAIVRTARVEAQPATVLRPSRWWPMPAWAQAAAAVLVLGMGLAIANLQIRYDATGLTVSTGWMAPAASPAPVTGPEPAAWQPALAALETRLRTEMRSRESAVSAVPVSGIRVSVDEATLRRVAALIEQSETRQEQELARRLTQVSLDFNRQRVADLTRIDNVWRGFQGRTGADIARQNEMLNYIVRASQPQQ